VVIGFTTDYFTDIDQKAVQNTATGQHRRCDPHPGGFSYGLLSIVPSILASLQLR